MKLVFTFVLFLFCYVAIAQVNLFSHKKETKPEIHSEKLDAEYGFNGILLESDFTSFSHMELKDEDGHTKYYTRTKEDVKFETFEVYSIKYCFYKTKLMMVTITTKGINNSRGMLEMLQKEYGSGGLGKNSSYLIMGEKVKLSYLQHPKTHEGRLLIMSLPLTATMFEEEREAASKF